MKARITGVPQNIDENSRSMVENNLLGHIFPVVGRNSLGLYEIEIGEALGMPAYMYSFWIEPDCVELVEQQDGIQIL